MPIALAQSLENRKLERDAIQLSGALASIDHSGWRQVGNGAPAAIVTYFVGTVLGMTVGA